VSTRRKPAPLGLVFASLTVIGDGEPYVNQRDDRLTTASRWRVRCVCGAEKDVLPTHLRAGRTTSCGCQNRPRGREVQFYGCNWPSGCVGEHNARGLCRRHYDLVIQRIHRGAQFATLLDEPRGTS